MTEMVIRPKMGQTVFAIVWIATLLQLSLAPASGVILKGTGNPEANTSAPTGKLAGSGWQYQGAWGDFLGTPVAAQYFIAASHVGGAVGQAFEFNGATYHTVACYGDPETDLRLWKVDRAFPVWAPLYLGGDEAGKPLVVFGRGTQRGEPVYVQCLQTNLATKVVNLRRLGITRREVQAVFPDAFFQDGWMKVKAPEVTTNNCLKGWKSGVADGCMRWGVNQVASAGGFIVATFDRNEDGNEACLSSGDSSGAVFIREKGVWKLAGINYGVEGPYSTSLSEPYFYGAIFDKTGLFEDGMSTPYEPVGQANPICFYATRISPRLPWILSITNP